MQLVLFDTPAVRQSLYPFAEIRPVAHIRMGLYTIKERWQQLFPDTLIHLLTEDYLLEEMIETAEPVLYIHSSVVPTVALKKEAEQLKPGQGINNQSLTIAFKTDVVKDYGFTEADCAEISFTATGHRVSSLQYPFQITELNAQLLEEDIQSLLRTETSKGLSTTNYITNLNGIFMEEGATAEHAYINASTGPVYIGRNVLIMEGSMIRGPVALLEGTVVKMGAKIYGAVTTGKKCTVGGEIKNAVFFDYSNKAHDGYLGDAVIGAWCNLGAGTSASNVKNTAGEVKVWNPKLHQWINAGNKCGVMMGDYSRTAINTSLNTGTVTGVCCNIFSNGFPPKYIPDFTWNILDNERYVFSKAIDTIANWKQMKQQTLVEREKEILQYIYNSQL
jgi:UDP-N-acetylglucosamine diphosphorylase / glucose-1-phosphate thymidylyltransferase / UDP-N-acetylgalactosamine diphosphorylase / glucosamine-1-phosphate N-acetyltransferase / galactosamine-1-phosphate N-acetyltransferase